MMEVLHLPCGGVGTEVAFEFSRLFRKVEGLVANEFCLSSIFSDIAK